MGAPGRPPSAEAEQEQAYYLLSGLLFAKQDGGPLVGVLFPAEPLEKAVLALVQEVLADVPQLRERIEWHIREQTEAAPVGGEQLDELKKQREAVRRRTETILSTFDDETLADARQEIERLRNERRRLDEQIAAAEAASRAKSVDPAQLADEVIARVCAVAGSLSEMPTFALREVLGGLVGRVVGDMETKQVEVTLALPSWAFGGEGVDKPLRLVGTSASSASYQTHRVLTLKLGEADCRYLLSRTACYDCRRRAAA